MIEFHIIAATDEADNLSDKLFLLGASAVSQEETASSNEIELIALFEDKSSANLIKAYLKTQQEEQLIKAFYLLDVEDKDWLRVCLDQFKPQCFGEKLWVCPSWCEPPRPDAINVMLDPGHAFGTGTHPTTKLCLEWLDQHIKGDETIIDYGCGSGILAIAALKLGAANAVAIDNDQEALNACLMNLKQNQISADKLAILLPENLVSIQADILMANILFQPLIELHSHFANLVKPGGKIILSGILHTQVPEIVKIYQKKFIMSEPVLQEEWARLEGKKI